MMPPQAYKLFQPMDQRGFSRLALLTRAHQQSAAGHRREGNRDLELGVIIATGLLKGISPSMVEDIFTTGMGLQISGRCGQRFSLFTLHKQMLRQPACPRRGASGFFQCGEKGM